MPKSDGPTRFASAMQAFHGFDLKVESRQGPYPGSRTWEVHIPETGFLLSGTHSEIMACLRGYQSGYLAGRVYSRKEQDGLRGLIQEVEARFKETAS